MPVYEFRNRRTGELREEVYVSWRDAPRELVEAGDTWERVPSRVGMAVVIEGQRAELRRLEKKGVVPYESGMDRDINETRLRQEKKAEADRHQIIRDTLAQF